MMTSKIISRVLLAGSVILSGCGRKAAGPPPGAAAGPVLVYELEHSLLAALEHDFNVAVSQTRWAMGVSVTVVDDSRAD